MTTGSAPDEPMTHSSARDAAPVRTWTPPDLAGEGAAPGQAPPRADGEWLPPQHVAGSAPDHDDVEEDPVPVAAAPVRDRTAYSSLVAFPHVGDAGRQPEVVPVGGDLTVGIPDTVLDFLTVDPFEVRGCAARGLSHRQAGTPRQDAFAIGADDEWLVIAVCDGVSSGPHSHVAAETGARATVRLLIRQLAEDPASEPDWSSLCGRVSRRIVDEAIYRQLADVPEDADTSSTVREVQRAMATTAVVVAIRRQPDATGHFGGYLAVLAGDSGAYLVQDGRMVTVAGGKDDGGSAVVSGSVRPLPGAAAPVAQPLSLAGGQALVLTTDGVGDALGDGTTELGLHLAERWSTPPAPDAFFGQVNFLRRSFDDDRTAVGLWILPEVTPVPDQDEDI